MKGKVKFFDQTKGFGFIVSDDGKEYFVHQTGLEPGVSLNENDVVTFDVVDGDRGPKADHVKKATGGKSAPADDDDMMSDDDDE
ncbi:MAG: cold shock domain-containing protein [Candidatus Woesearchaeota archaeon]|nr:MAG: cold shock domain-containing protein [Candidatus Woesearchaeota archaeon]